MTGRQAGGATWGSTNFHPLMLAVISDKLSQHLTGKFQNDAWSFRFQSFSFWKQQHASISFRDNTSLWRKLTPKTHHPKFLGSRLQAIPAPLPMPLFPTLPLAVDIPQWVATSCSVEEWQQVLRVGIKNVCLGLSPYSVTPLRPPPPHLGYQSSFSSKGSVFYGQNGPSKTRLKCRTLAPLN